MNSSHFPPINKASDWHTQQGNGWNSFLYLNSQIKGDYNFSCEPVLPFLGILFLTFWFMNFDKFFKHVKLVGQSLSRISKNSIIQCQNFGIILSPNFFFAFQCGFPFDVMIPEFVWPPFFIYIKTTKKNYNRGKTRSIFTVYKPKFEIQV